MERIVYRKTLDVHKSGSQFVLQGFETADNMSRVIEIGLCASGDSIDLPMGRIVAMMYVTTPGAAEPSINACTIKNNKVIYEVLPITEEGLTKMQLKLIETSADGAKSVLAAPRFDVEVTKSNADDESAEQTTTYTALEIAIAKANAVHETRLTKIDITPDLIFKALYADGGEYETTAIKDVVGSVSLDPKGEYNETAEYHAFDIVTYDQRVYMATNPSTGKVPVDNADYWSDIFDLNKAIAAQYDELNNEEIAKLLKSPIAEYSGDLAVKSDNPTLVSWDADSKNTPFSEEKTTISNGFALIYGDPTTFHTICAWAMGSDKDIIYVAATKNNEFGGYHTVLTQQRFEEKITFGKGETGTLFADDDGTYLGHNESKLKVSSGSVKYENGSDDFELLGEHNLNLLGTKGFVRIASGEYTGRGKSGSSYPTSIIIEGFTPRLVLIQSVNNPHTNYCYDMSLEPFSPFAPDDESENEWGVTYGTYWYSSSASSSIKRVALYNKWDKEKSTLYLRKNSTDPTSDGEALLQMNYDGETYTWIAVG